MFVLSLRQECSETASTLEKNAGCFCCLGVGELSFFCFEEPVEAQGFHQLIFTDLLSSLNDS